MCCLYASLAPTATKDLMGEAAFSYRYLRQPEATMPQPRLSLAVSLALIVTHPPTHKMEGAGDDSVGRQQKTGTPHGSAV